MACAMGETLSPVLFAIGKDKQKKQPRKSLTLTLISAAMCAEKQAWEADLQRRQMLFLTGKVEQGETARFAIRARDFIEQEKRAHVVAANRNYQAFQKITAAFQAPSDTQKCPTKLKEEEQLAYLLGMTAGLLAVLHDGKADNTNEVSLGIPLLVEQGVSCLDSQKWWRVPEAIQAVVWLSIPGALPAGKDPWKQLELAAVGGEAQGSWLARALQVVAAESAGKDAILINAIRNFSKTHKQQKADANYALLNSYAYSMIQYYSDRIWMDQTGQRTPLGKLGQFPDDESKEESASEELLEGLVPEEDSPPAASQSPSTQSTNQTRGKK